MKLILQKWILFAQSDLDAAKRLFNSPKPTHWTYLLVLWHCHQTIEKALKMIIIKKKKELLKIHDLPRLSSLAEINLSKQQTTLLEELNKFYLRSRYPDLIYKPLSSPNRKIAKELLIHTKKLFLWLKPQ
ncbi:MAG: HEPN domain-containing protein [Parcubacteria group bacterium]|nr:HEPN domain-containing protein [Parcubacteria group bacterium]